MTFEIFMAAYIEIVEFWVVTPFILLCGCQSFGEKCAMIYVSRFDIFLLIHKPEARRPQHEFSWIFPKITPCSLVCYCLVGGKHWDIIRES